jgi:hypothetical protein
MSKIMSMVAWVKNLKVFMGYDDPLMPESLFYSGANQAADISIAPVRFVKMVLMEERYIENGLIPRIPKEVKKNLYQINTNYMLEAVELCVKKSGCFHEMDNINLLAFFEYRGMTFYTVYGQKEDGWLRLLSCIRISL